MKMVPYVSLMSSLRREDGNQLIVLSMDHVGARDHHRVLVRTSVSGSALVRAELHFEFVQVQHLDLDRSR